VVGGHHESRNGWEVQVLRPRTLLKQLLQLAVLGLLVGLACWPFNLFDQWQDALLRRLPAFTGQRWSAQAVALACSPLLATPLVLWLQTGPWQRGAGSGIPQTMASIEDPDQARSLLGPVPTLQRLGLWGIATLALMPMGREGPVVQVGASVAEGLRRRFPALLPELNQGQLLAVAAGAGLAGGFNTPLMGAVFVAEELTRSFQASLVWPALVVCGVAAAFSNLAGQPEFALGILGVEPIELIQVLWAVPIGVAGGLLGALFGRLLLAMTARLKPQVRRYPLRIGMALGGLLSLFAVLSRGTSTGDGEALMTHILAGDGLDGVGSSLLTLVVRVIGPVLALGAGIPGGLIDPSLAFGAVFGRGLGDLAGLGPLGMALGMAAGLAGATQLPVMTVVFALRLAGDQQLLPGVLVSAVLAAYVSRLLLAKPIYHSLRELFAAPTAP
jgi:H+/Cl- antiporter ClcA